MYKERKHFHNFVEKEDRVGLEDLESAAGKGKMSQDRRIEIIEKPHSGTGTDKHGGADQSHIIQEQASKEGSEPQTSHSSEIKNKNKTASSIARPCRTVSSHELRILHTGPQTQKEAAAAVDAHENQGNTLTSCSLSPVKETAILDKDKNIAFLLKELDSMRDINKKLQDRLSGKERELETRKLDVELQDKGKEAHAAQQAAALVEEIYHAQRERDQAVMARLRLANEERDEALLRAKRLEQAIVELENINPEENDTSLQELLNRVNNADSGLLIEKSGAVIVDRIRKTRERRKKITAEEMNAVIEERDAAISKCKRLEQEVHHLKEQSQTSANNMRHLTAENNQERALKAQLLSIQQERDSALQQSKKLEDEIQTLRVYYSLHKSLSQEANLKEQFQCTLSTYEDALHSKEGIVSLANLHNDQLITQLQLALSERANMEAQLQQSLEAQKEAHEKVQKLERLVDVLRKKVGAGTVRTVI
ncbi:mirror-image polydactyly gene 1 protein-like isoform X2 [Polyodon spathula]|uniref:mirror-image polydactyly gene 1 protein-like isoform X2 n=1 Tax=Polyodon spathula TaxID=7913 RepID=UPI001B7E8F5B|nr:mirror-image polydactyly gene 1 protein-like isoform X2 [Polyodon spathula]